MIDRPEVVQGRRPIAALQPSIAAAFACAVALPLCNTTIGLMSKLDERPCQSLADDHLRQAALLRNEPITPVSIPTDIDSAKVALGRSLFHEPSLSSTGTISCASCHSLVDGGDDGRRYSVGINGMVGAKNAPTVLNAALNFRQFWDGRAATLEEQVEGPIENAIEMGSNWKSVIAFLEGDPAYRDWFERIYADGVTKANVIDVIAEFERFLITPDSPFDQWLKGDEEALTELQQRGYVLFKENGCISCHQGANVGGNIYQKLGVMVDYFNDHGAGRDEHLGRYQVTGDPKDLHVFKVPGLRNVAQTAPYFHDGSAESLEEAVVVMFRHQLGMPADRDTVRAISAFLESLSADPRWESL